MTAAKQAKGSVEPGEYAAFIKQIQIEDISLLSADVTKSGYEQRRRDFSVVWKSQAWFENHDRGFVVFQRYRLNIKDAKTKQRVAKLSVTFSLAYRSDLALTDEIFEIFEEINVTLNTWPYFREFTHNTLARMNLPQVVAPLHKVSLRPM